MELINFSLLAEKVVKLAPTLEVAFIAIILILIFNFILLIAKKNLLRRAKTKRQVSNIKILARITNIIVTSIIIIFSFLSYVKSWTGIGVILGLVTAAIGFALQKPITGMAAWLMVVFKRPFQVGDRLTVGDFKGDVYDISLTHLYIDEVGGDIDTEQHSGRNIMIPNYKLFEEDIINHTLTHDNVLGEIRFAISYDSDLDKALAIVQTEAVKMTGEYARSIKKDVAVRVEMTSSGLTIKIHFFAPVHKMSEIKSNLTQTIYDSLRKEKKIKFA